MPYFHRIKFHYLVVEGEELINKDGQNAEILNTFLSNAAKNLEIPEYQEIDSLANDICHPIFKAILKYRNHPRIVAIKNLNKGSGFDFCRVSVQDVFKEIKKLSTRKVNKHTDLPVKILKENSGICDFFSDCVDRGNFSSILKIANIIPVLKKGNRDLKDNYQPVSILPVISKILENFLCKQTAMFIDPLLSKFQCGFRKGRVMVLKIVFLRC